MRAFGFAALASAAFIGPALAHHSFAMFNAEKTLVLDGTVEGFDWTNPHSWVRLAVANDAGEKVVWTLELGAPGDLARHGWRPKSMVPGDKVSITIHPLKDGSHGGQLISAVLANGTKVGGQT